MVRVKIYVEGGGNSKELQTRCREGFQKLIEKAGFKNRMPAIVACGGRQRAYDMFQTAATIGDPNKYPLLLADSEDPLDQQLESSYGHGAAWQHFQARDGWIRPNGAQDDQAQMMVTCMESWIMSDRATLRRVFGAGIQESALLPVDNLEQKSRHDVQQALENATRQCGRDKAYSKGRRSFQVLAALDPDTLKSKLPYFKRFITTLNSLLPEGDGSGSRNVCRPQRTGR